MKSGNTHLIQYERMSKTEWGRSEDCRVFGASIDEPMTRANRRDVEFGGSKKVAEDLRHRRQGGQFIDAEDHRVDPPNWLHHNNIHSCQAGAGEKNSRRRDQHLKHEFASWLERLGYALLQF